MWSSGMAWQESLVIGLVSSYLKPFDYRWSDKLATFPIIWSDSEIQHLAGIFAIKLGNHGVFSKSTVYLLIKMKSVKTVSERFICAIFRILLFLLVYLKY